MKRKILKYAIKAKKITNKSIQDVYDMPLEKIIIGTTAAIVPGGIVISGVYIATQELKQRYIDYLKMNKEKGEDSSSFPIWLNENYAEYLKEKKDQVVDNVTDKLNDTVDCLEKGVSTVSKTITNTIKKIIKKN
jgi:hypothetical protein